MTKSQLVDGNSDQDEQQLTVQEINIEELPDGGGEKLMDPKKNIDLVKNVQVNMDVVVGKAELSVGELFNLNEGSVVRIDRDASEPLDLVLDGKVVARGFLVAVGENFGIQIAGTKL